MRSRILAIDPGYDRLGLAVIDVAGGGGTLVTSTCLTTDKYAPLSERLAAIYDGISEAIIRHTPSVIAVETLVVSLNKKTVIAVAEARGVVLLAAGKHAIEVIEISPQQVKLAMTGSGNANKSQVQKMVALTLRIDVVGKLDDEIDAIAIGFAAIGVQRTAALLGGGNTIAKKNSI